MELFKNLRAVDIQWTPSILDDSRLIRLQAGTKEKPNEDNPSPESVAAGSLETLRIEVLQGPSAEDVPYLERMKQLRCLLQEFDFPTIRHLDLRLQYPLALFPTWQSEDWDVESSIMAGLETFHMSCTVAVQGGDTDFDLMVGSEGLSAEVSDLKAHLVLTIGSHQDTLENLACQPHHRENRGTNLPGVTRRPSRESTMDAWLRRGRTRIQPTTRDTAFFARAQVTRTDNPGTLSPTVLLGGRC